MEKFIVANGSVVRVASRGEAENSSAVVLIHGYLEAIESWESFVPLLTPSTRVVAIDLPGHGVSPTKSKCHTMAFLAQTVVDVLAKLGIEKAVVVGHSMGGYVVQEMVCQDAGVIKGAVLLHSSLSPDTDKKQQNRIRQIEVIKSGRKELLKGMIPNRFAEQNRHKFAEQIEDMREQAVMTEDEGAIAILNGMNSRQELTQCLKTTDTPLLSIYGRHDDYIDAESAQKQADNFSNMKVVWLEQSGHMGFIEEPEACANAILEFTASCFKE